jgi:hypothetical protein
MVRSTGPCRAGAVGTPALVSGFPERLQTVLSRVSRREAGEATGWAGRGCWPKESACRLNRWLTLFVLVAGGGSAATMASGVRDATIR